MSDSQSSIDVHCAGSSRIYSHYLASQSQPRIVAVMMAAFIMSLSLTPARRLVALFRGGNLPGRRWKDGGGGDRRPDSIVVDVFQADGLAGKFGDHGM